ncbi:ATP-binding protein [Patescibacteria group bacterium]
MSYFILIRGPLGSGKTTISKKLAESLNAEEIRMDDVLDKHGLDKIDEKEECIPARNFIEANQIILPSVEKHLENEKIVIFDACFYHQEAIDDLIESLDFPHFAFTLKLPLEICIERDSKRDKVYGEGAAWAVHNLVSKFDYGNLIDVSQNLDETIEEILSYLPKTD